jgi:hypothetical protein
MSFRKDVRGGLFAGRDPLPQDVHTTLWGWPLRGQRPAPTRRAHNSVGVASSRAETRSHKTCTQPCGGGLFAGRDPLPQDVHITLWERVSARE